MDNVTRALLIAFSMMMFVIGFTFSMYMINKLLSTSSVLLDTVSTTNYYDNIEVINTDNVTREVGIETIIPVLYRYYKENYSVRIVEEVDQNGKKVENLIQLFDLSMESQISNAARYTGNTDVQKISLKSSIYNTPENKAYMFSTPWAGNLENARIRIDYFLNGTKGYINNGLVDYSKDGPTFKNIEGGFLKYCEMSYKIEESFVEYAYKGETISTPNGIETITGSTQESSKIIITYKLIKN